MGRVRPQILERSQRRHQIPRPAQRASAVPSASCQKRRRKVSPSQSNPKTKTPKNNPLIPYSHCSGRTNPTRRNDQNPKAVLKADPRAQLQRAHQRCQRQRQQFPEHHDGAQEVLQPCIPDPARRRTGGPRPGEPDPR